MGGDSWSEGCGFKSRQNLILVQLWVEKQIQPFESCNVRLTTFVGHFWDREFRSFGPTFWQGHFFPPLGDSLDQEYIDRARPIFLLSFSCFIQQLLMTLINLSGKFKAMIWTHWQPPYRRSCWESVFKGVLGLLIRCLWATPMKRCLWNVALVCSANQAFYLMTLLFWSLGLSTHHCDN